ncbi:tetratricopeptide repeat protein [Streptomyces xanthophaeus]|uniref:tetratricopeptide repeat protein n=1 Tax=Streptomyces xanthophaeus TaxID=67385 RepID=UPI00343841AE
MGVEQQAEASGGSQITQIAGNQYVYGPGAGPAPQALLGLPEAPPALVGRDGPARELAGLLAEGGSPVAVVAGLAGVGKSALAVTTAHRAVELGWFADRVFFLSLRGYAPDGGVSGPQAVQEILGRLGIRDTDLPSSPQGQVALYQACLGAYARAGQRVLIVADDAGSVAQVRDLVPAGDTHRLLITSRHRLVSPGLAARLVALDELEAEPAVQLLSGALLRRWPDDPRPAREPAALAAVAEACGRLPLALTVAGALLAGDPGLPAGALAAQLADARTRLEALTFDEGDGGVPVGVRAAFGLSYERLPTDQARVLRLLTVNPGPDCSTFYAQLVTGEGEDLRSKLAALVRASLLTEQPVGSGRWRMHDLVRLYAQERGEECAQEDGREGATASLLESLAVHMAGAEMILGLRERPETAPGLPSAAQVLRWLDLERPLLIAALRLALDTGRRDTARSLADALTMYLVHYGHEDDALAVARHMLAAVRQTGDGKALGTALCNLAGVLSDMDQGDEAHELLTEALVLCPRIPFREGEGHALNVLAGLHRKAGRFEEALQAHADALEIFRELGIRQAEAAALGLQGEALRKAGRLDEAVEVYRASIAICEEIGQRHREATARYALGEALWEAGHREESLTVREQAAAIFRESGNRTNEARAHHGLADSLLDEGRPEEARARYELALALFGEAGDEPGVCSVLGELGRVHRQEGRLEEALEAQVRCCGLLADAGLRSDLAVELCERALTLALMDRVAEAVDAFERAAALFGSVGAPEKEAMVQQMVVRLRQIRARPRRWWHRFTR